VTAPRATAAAADFDSMSASRRRAMPWILLYVAVLLLPLGLAALKAPAHADSFVKQIALGLGLFGLMIIATNFILAARYQWLVGPFGLDTVMLFHRRMALTGFAAILLHITLMTILKIHLLTQWRQPLRIQLGRTAILLLTAQIIVSVYRSGMGVKFEKWKSWHRVLAVGILAVAFSHGLLSSGRFAPWPLRLVVMPVALIALWSIIWSRIIRPRRLREFPYAVREVRKIGRAVWEIKLQSVRASRSFEYRPGQFAFFHFHRSAPEASSEEHVWTIASSPSESDGLMLAIKELGDFTRTMDRTRVGDEVTVHGPFGRFSHRLYKDMDDIVFIAAGIGITPFRSMIRWMTDRGETRKVQLLYGNRSAAEIAFLDELTDCEKRGGGKLRVTHVLSQPDEHWSGEKGRIDIDVVRRHCGGELGGKSFWICGPGPFATVLIESLRRAGVPPGKIHSEAFCLLHAPVQADGRGRSLKALSAAICLAAFVTVLMFALIRTDFLSAYRGSADRGAQPRAVRVP